MTQAAIFSDANAAILTWIEAVLEGAKNSITIAGDDTDDPPTIYPGPLASVNTIITEDRTRAVPRLPVIYVGFGEQLCSPNRLSEGRIEQWTATVNLISIVQNATPATGGELVRNLARMALGSVMAEASQATRPACVHDIIPDRFVPSSEQYVLENSGDLYCAVAVVKVGFLVISPETLAELVE